MVTDAAENPTPEAVRLNLTKDELRRLWAQSPPPQDWYDEDHSALFCPSGEGGNMAADTLTNPTPEAVRQMPAGQELDDLVDRLVFGGPDTVDGPNGPMPLRIPHSRVAATVWRMVDHLVRRGWRFELWVEPHGSPDYGTSRAVDASFTRLRPHEDVEVHAPGCTVAEAIARAVVLAVLAEKDLSCETSTSSV